LEVSRPGLGFMENDRDREWRVDLDRADHPDPPRAGCRAQAFTLWLRSARFGRHGHEAAGLIHEVLRVNPFTTLQVVLEPAGELSPEAVRREVGAGLLNELLAACLANPTYLDNTHRQGPPTPRLGVDAAHGEMRKTYIQEGAGAIPEQDPQAAGRGRHFLDPVDAVGQVGCNRHARITPRDKG
jgi:hypothetical protein